MRWPEGFMSLLAACRWGNCHIDKKYMSLQFLSTRADLDPIDAKENGGGDARERQILSISSSDMHDHSTIDEKFVGQ